MSFYKIMYKVWSEWLFPHYSKIHGMEGLGQFAFLQGLLGLIYLFNLKALSSLNKNQIQGLWVLSNRRFFWPACNRGEMLDKPVCMCFFTQYGFWNWNNLDTRLIPVRQNKLLCVHTMRCTHSAVLTHWHMVISYCSKYIKKHKASSLGSCSSLVPLISFDAIQGVYFWLKRWANGCKGSSPEFSFLKMTQMSKDKIIRGIFKPYLKNNNFTSLSHELSL